MQVCIKTGWTDGRPKTVNTNARWSRLGLFPEPRMIRMYSCLQNGCFWTGTLWAGCPHQSNTTASWCQKASTEKKKHQFYCSGLKIWCTRGKKWNSLWVFGWSFPHFSFQTTDQSYFRNGKWWAESCLPILKPLLKWYSWVWSHLL